jgi:Domain of unknown function (DUF5658)
LPWETWVLAAICFADMVSTVLLVKAGKAVEANPVLIPALRKGVGWFLLVKSIYFVVPLVCLELLRTHRPKFVRTMLRAGITAYIAIYVVGGIRLNMSSAHTKNSVAAESKQPTVSQPTKTAQ